MRDIRSFKNFSDSEITIELTRLAAEERRATAKLVACLEEFDRRRLYLGYGFSSIYAYCKEKLHLSDDAAYRRIEVARASRRFPQLLDMIDTGSLSITTACLIAQKLSHDCADVLFARAAFKSKQEVERLIAALYPQPPVPSLVRKLPELKPQSPTPAVGTFEAEARLLAGPESPVIPLAPAISAPSRRPVIAPLSEAHYKLQVTIGAAAREKLRQIQDLMRHRIPNGDPAFIIEHALDLLHMELLKRKAAEVERPRRRKEALDPKGRYIPAAVRRTVFRRDRGRCAFVSAVGRRCGSTSGLEFHHVRPVAVGGEATIANIEMRCRAHNGFEWERHLDSETEALVER
jgi:hypothetical protein